MIKNNSLSFLLIALFALSACGDNPETESFNQNLKTKIEQGKHSIYINELTDFPWDNVYFAFSDYSKEELEQAIGVQYEGNIPSNMCDPFEKADLIFVRNNSVIILKTDYCKISHSCQDTKVPQIKKCSENAYFFVEEKYANNKYYNLLTIKEEILK